jgi:hypothetical protein
VAQTYSYKNRRPVLTAPRAEREIRGLLLVEVALETAHDGPPISSRRLSLFERDPQKFPLSEAEDLRRRAAIERLSRGTNALIGTGGSLRP